MCPPLPGPPRAPVRVARHRPTSTTDALLSVHFTQCGPPSPQHVVAPCPGVRGTECGAAPMAHHRMWPAARRSATGRGLCLRMTVSAGPPNGGPPPLCSSSPKGPCSPFTEPLFVNAEVRGHWGFAVLWAHGTPPNGAPHRPTTALPPARARAAGPVPPWGQAKRRRRPFPAPLGPTSGTCGGDAQRPCPERRGTDTPSLTLSHRQQWVRDLTYALPVSRPTSALPSGTRSRSCTPAMPPSAGRRSLQRSWLAFDPTPVPPPPLLYLCTPSAPTTPPRSTTPMVYSVRLDRQEPRDHTEHGQASTERT